MREVVIVCSGIARQEVKEMLEENLGENGGKITLELRGSETRYRSIEPSVLIALIAAGGAGVVELLRGIWNMARDKRKMKIILQAKDGRRVEVPASCSREELEYFWNKVGQPDVSIIEVVATKSKK